MGVDEMMINYTGTVFEHLCGPAEHRQERRRNLNYYFECKYYGRRKKDSRHIFS